MKGIGKDHAKFSPVATASYRLMPGVELKAPVTGADAEQLKSICPLNVFDIEEGKGAYKTKKAVVSRPRDCSVCRECIRLEGWVDRVRLTRVPDHFIFKVESVGMLSPREIVEEAIAVLKKKCTDFLEILDGADGDEVDEAVEGDAVEDEVAEMLS